MVENSELEDINSAQTAHEHNADLVTIEMDVVNGYGKATESTLKLRECILFSITVVCWGIGYILCALGDVEGNGFLATILATAVGKSSILIHTFLFRNRRHVITGSNRNLSRFMAFLHPSIATVGFICMWNAIQKKVPAPLVQVLSVANMLVPIFIGTVFLKEVLSTRQKIGAVFMLLGCCIAVFRGTFGDDDYPVLQLWNCAVVALTFGIATAIIFIVGKRICEQEAYVWYGSGTLPLFAGVLIALYVQGKDYFGLNSWRGFVFTVAAHVLNQIGTVSSTVLSQSDNGVAKSSALLPTALQTYNIIAIVGTTVVLGLPFHVFIAVGSFVVIVSAMAITYPESENADTDGTDSRNDARGSGP